MKAFLQQVYLDNSVKNYLTVAGVILIGFLFKKYIAHYLTSAFFYLLRSRYKSIKNKSFVSLVAKPLGLFIAILITIIALDRLHFPQVLDIKIYHLRLKDLLRMIATTLLIVSFFVS